MWESEQPYLVSDFSGIALNFSPFKLMLPVGWLQSDFIIFRYIHCFTNLSRTFLMRGYWILSLSNEMIMSGFFFSKFVNVVDYIYCFLYWNIPESLGWSLLDHGDDLCVCVCVILDFSLQEFYWACLHLYL